MNKTLVRTATGAWLFAGVAAATMLAAAAPASAASAPAGPRVSASIAKVLPAAITAIQAKDYAGAEAQLNTAKATAGLTEVDLIEIDVVVAYLALSKNDHALALATYKKITASPLFTQVESPDEQKQTLRNMMLLSSEAKDYAGAVQVGERIAAAGIMDDTTAAALSQAYYYNKDFAKAQSLAQKSVDAAIAAGKKPDRGSLQIIMNSYADQKDQVGARKVLEQLALYHGNPEYWAKMCDITLGTSPGLKDMQILQIYRLRVLSGADGDAGDYLAGSELAMKNGYPGEARSILKTATARGVGGVSGKLSEANAKAAADEKTLAAGEAAGAKSASGQLDLIVAEQYYGYGQYGAAVTAAKRAISKGGTKDAEEPKMVVGMALAADGKYQEAVDALALVGGSESQKKIAHIWTVYAKSKMQPAATAAAPAAH